jgi:hypothetical protein
MNKNQSESKESIEDIVLRHSGRGMDILRGYKTDRYAEKAAQTILGWEKGRVFLTTGFFVAGFAETDGPVGTLFLAKALQKLGYKPVILTDEFCKGFFESEGIQVLYMPFDADLDWCMTQLGTYTPVGLISIERCGENAAREYANMRGVSITDKTAAADLFFRIALGIVPTIGVGDGGNEIGMGNMASIIEEKLSLKPCVVTVDQLVIATVSNWGAYAIIAYLEKLSGVKVFMDFEEAKAFIKKTVEMGSVDGVLKKPIVSVDGFGMEIEKEIIDSLGAAI